MARSEDGAGHRIIRGRCVECGGAYEDVLGMTEPGAELVHPPCAVRAYHKVKAEFPDILRRLDYLEATIKALRSGRRVLN